VPLLDDDEIIEFAPAAPSFATTVAALAPAAGWGYGQSFGQGGVASTAPTPAGWGIGQGSGQGIGVGSTTPRAVTITGWPQDEKSRTPAIPEAELLSVLTEIVKRDADQAVRNEALQGIYRMRSDAAINTLIQLYDGTSDVKVKGEIVGYLIRNNGDKSKAVAKLLTIAKSEQNEDLRSRAIRTLARVKGDDGANNLIQIYDSLQDTKLKQRVISSLANNKSRKAIDKLIQIAKTDTDPTIRQAAIRSLYAIDNRLYLEFADGIPRKISRNLEGFMKIELDAARDSLERMKLDGEFKWSADQMKLFEESQLKLKEELPKMKLKMKEFDPNFNFNFDHNFEFDLGPEFQDKFDELLAPRPKVERRATPAPAPKPNK
jgi:HEAT repeat protein